MTDTPRQRIYGQCPACKHVWHVLTTPMELNLASRLMGNARCPECGAGPRGVTLANPPVPDRAETPPPPPAPPDDGWEYAVTHGPRKAWSDANVPPEGEGWEPDYSQGRPGQAWDRFDYHEESYWKRRKPTEPSDE